MANLTEDGHYTTTSPEFLCIYGLGAAQKIFMLAASLFPSIVAFVGNFLIIIRYHAFILYSRHIDASTACIALLLSLMISSFCYTKIYRTRRLSQARVQVQAHQGQQNGEGIQLNKARYRKTVSIALWVQMALLACYLPFDSVIGFISISGLNTPFLNFAWTLTISLLLSNSSVNPLLYCWKMREIREAMKHTIRQFCRFPSQET